MPTSAGYQTYNYTQLRNLWIKAGGSRPWSYVMAAIAMAESGGNPHARHVDANGSVDWGLWQINSVHFRGNVNATTMQEPSANAKEAVAVFNSSGPHAWSTYNNGAYKHYMPGNQNAPPTGFGWGVFTSPSSVDQGVDFTGKGPIPALDKAKVTDVGHVNIIEGGSWPEVIYQLMAGPYKGSYVYTMENFQPQVKKGDTVVRGQPIGEAKGASPYIETGFNRQPVGINPIAPLYPNPHSPKAAGLVMQKYIKADTAQGGGNTGGGGGGVGSAITTGLNDATGGLWGDITGGASSAANTIEHPLAGIEGLIMQGFFIMVGVTLFTVGIALLAWAVLQKTGAPGVVGMVQGQMRISQAGARTRESQRASMVREGQASARLSEQAESRKLRERRLVVHEQGVKRSGFEDRRFTNVRRDDRTATRNKPGKKASGVPRK